MSKDTIKPLMMGEFQVQLLSSLFDEDQCLPHTRGGPAVSNLVFERLKRGMPTDVLTLSETVDAPVQLFSTDLLNLWIVKRRPNKCIRDGYAEERRLIREVIAQSDADLCHAHWTYEYALAAVAQESMPYVVTVRDHCLHILKWVGLDYLGQYLITRYVLHKAKNQLTAVSPYIASYISKITHCSVPVIPNVVPLLRAHQNERLVVNEDKDIILTVADDGDLKNVKRAIRAFQLFRKQRTNIYYELVGSGLGIEQSIARWALSKGLDENIIFSGWTSRNDVLKKISEARLAFHPSLEESFGNPVAEAMAMGIPVIGAREAGGVQWLLENDAGWLFSGRNIASMTETLRLAYSDANERIKRSINAKKRINEICSADRIIADYDSTYRKVLQAWSLTS